MCGICGYIGKNIDRTKASRMLDTIEHRGPDYQGSYFEEKVFLGHSRLAILDLSEAGNQPMSDYSEKFTIIFNGEIYNYRELRQELKEFGITFKSNSDTEVIVNGYSLIGDKIFTKLNGIFSIAIWNKQEQSLILARDRYGVKPLYYSLSNNSLTFGSEIKSILISNQKQFHNINFKAFSEFLKYGNNIGEQTLFDGVSEVKPGCTIKFEETNIVEKSFWNILDINEIETKDDDAISSTKFLLEEAVKRQLLSDVPVGVFLSGGIDSSMVTAFASKHYLNKLDTYTAGFDFLSQEGELEKARKVADYYKTNHHEIFISGFDVADTVQTLVACHDSPFSDAANIPLYLMTKKLNGSPKVILQGDGGDEFFAGYYRHEMIERFGVQPYTTFFQTLRICFDLFPRFVVDYPKFNKLKRFLDVYGHGSAGDILANISTKNSNINEFTSLLSSSGQNIIDLNNPNSRFIEFENSIKDRDILQKLLYSETQFILPRTFLEKVDKSTMANSIEVRVPLLDNDLTQYALSLNSSIKYKKNNKKWLLRNSLNGIVPDFVLNGKKTGFGVPYSNWLKLPLKDLMFDTFQNGSFSNLGIFNSKMILKMATDHCNNKGNNGMILWKLMNFGIWIDKYKMNFNAN